VQSSVFSGLFDIYFINDCFFYYEMMKELEFFMAGKLLGIKTSKELKSKFLSFFGFFIKKLYGKGRKPLFLFVLFYNIPVCFTTY